MKLKRRVHKNKVEKSVIDWPLFEGWFTYTLSSVFIFMIIVGIVELWAYMSGLGKAIGTISILVILAKHFSRKGPGLI